MLSIAPEPLRLGITALWAVGLRIHASATMNGPCGRLIELVKRGVRGIGNRRRGTAQSDGLGILTKQMLLSIGRVTPGPVLDEREGLRRSVERSRQQEAA